VTEWLRAEVVQFFRPPRENTITLGFLLSSVEARLKISDQNACLAIKRRLFVLDQSMENARMAKEDRLETE